MRKIFLTLSVVLATAAAAQAQVNAGSLNAAVPAGLNANPGLLNPANPQVKPLPPANNGASVDSLAAAPPAVPPAPAAPVPPAAPPANPNAAPPAPPAAPAPVPAAPVPPANPNAGPNVNPNNPLPLPPAAGPQVGPGGNVNNGLGLGGNMSAADKQALIARLQAALTHLEQLLAQTQDPIKKAKIEKRIMKIKKVLAQLI